jgi:hypothetical protein
VSAGDDDVYEFEELSTDGIFVLDIDTLREPEIFVADFYSNLVVIPRASGEHMPFVCKHPSERLSIYPFANNRV